MFNPILILLSTLIFGIFFLVITNQTDLNFKKMSILLSLIIFYLSIFLFLKFDPVSYQLQHVISFKWFYTSNFSIVFGIDGISIFFILLTTFLIPICLIISYNSIKEKVKLYSFLFLCLELFLILIFTVLDLFLFYIFFESVLIPLFLMIGIWGTRVRKMKAAYLFFFYTLFGSLIMLLAILHIYAIFGTTNYLILSQLELDKNLQIIYWFAFFISFAIKLPILPFHLWLAEAHVEAPTAGSVILAGILLKLGAYGLLRYSFILFPFATFYFKPLIYTLACISIIYSSLSAFRQTDLKRAVAYMSIAHMNMIVAGLFSCTINGIEGGIYQMLSHGLVSSALFISIGILYDRFHTRLISYYSGLVVYMPIYSCFFLLCILSNCAFPGTSSFIGEFLILNGLFQTEASIGLISLIGVLLSVFYSLWLYNRIIFGNLPAWFLQEIYDVTFIEMAILSLLLFIILLLGLNSSFICKNLEMSTLGLVYVLITNIF